MPVGVTNQQHDIYLSGNGYMLVRHPGAKQLASGRAWSRRGTSDLPRRSFLYDEGPYGHQPDEIDHASIFNDFSGGFGAAYRHPETPNMVSFSENMDLRFPNQMVHCQALQLLPNTRYSGSNANVEWIEDVPLPGVSSPPAGAGGVLVYGKGFVSSFTPTGLLTSGSQFDGLREATGANFVGRPATFGSFTYIGVATGNYYRRGFDGLTYTQGGVEAEGFANAGNKMFRRKGNILQSLAYGTVEASLNNWSATLPVGQGLMPINDMITRGDQLNVAMPDGLYVGDINGSFFNVLPEAISARHVDNGRDLNVYDGGIIYAGAPGMYWFQVSTLGGARGDSVEMGPQGIQSNRSPVRGRVRAQANLGHWEYAGLFTGSQSYILAGRVTQRPNYTWTIMQRLPHTSKVGRIHFDAITNASGNFNEMPTRQWVATDATFGATTGATAPLYVAPVPRLNDNPLLDLSFTANYCGSARVDLPFDDWGMPGIQKLFRSVEVWADNLASGCQYADIYATIDGSMRTYLGRAQQSPKSTVYFSGQNGVFQTGQACQISLESFTLSANTSPVYRAVVTRGAVRPRSIDVIEAAIRTSDGIRDRNGNQMRPGKVMLQELQNLVNPDIQGGAPVVLVDPVGLAQYVIVQPSLEQQEIVQEGTLPPEIATTVRMAVLTFTGNNGNLFVLQRAGLAAPFHG